MPGALPDVLPMRPYFRPMVWGGRRLAELYGKDLPAGELIGESFEVSAYPQRESRVAAGPLAAWDLRTLTAAHGEALVGRRAWLTCGGRFPLLVKLLDAQEDLSVQVHPGDEYARASGLPDSGKAEAWFVLHSQGGRVAHGLQPGVGKDELKAAVREGRVENVVRFHAVQAGDVLFSPPGTVHALCRGVVIYEVQQSSDLTFRIHDYGRLGLDGRPRPLHLEQALEVIDFAAATSGPVPRRDLAAAGDGPVRLVECEHFRLHFLRQAPSSVALLAASPSFASLTVVEGRASLRGEGAGHVLRAGETALIPSAREVQVAADPGGPCAYLVATAP
ncbi:MAG: type I phosphomannose isomerase catalytic subunit [Candidatus Latescibacterota bacterium]